MFKLSAGLAVFLAAASVSALHVTAVLGAPDFFVGLLAAAVALLAIGVAVAATPSVPRRFAVAAWAGTAAGLAVFTVGLATGLVVDGQVQSPLSAPAKAARQIGAVERDLTVLQDAAMLLSATPAEQFARAGQARKLSDRCAAVNRQWDRTPPADPALVDAVAGLKEGAAACSQGATVVGAASATPDAQTAAAVQQALVDVQDAMVRIESSIATTRRNYRLSGAPS